MRGDTKDAGEIEGSAVKCLLLYGAGRVYNIFLLNEHKNDSSDSLKRSMR